MNGPVLDPDKEESTMEALGMIETRGLVALIEASVWGSDQFWTECEPPGRTCKP
ncbi:hypothetical protein GTP84_26045 [Escherichia coli]|nr:hypothetical protein [Escherichia coli]EFH6320747.1 hypothetical protein [Escherichia coli]